MYDNLTVAMNKLEWLLREEPRKETMQIQRSHITNIFLTLDAHRHELNKPVTEPEAIPMIAYNILSSENAEDLSKQVTRAISDGWDLRGGVSVSLSESDDYRYKLFAQAMVKRH